MDKNGNQWIETKRRTKGRKKKKRASQYPPKKKIWVGLQE